MTARNFDEALRRVLREEGGYTAHPSDPGGPTNFGITIHDARKYWKSSATADDVKALPLEVAKWIYRHKYWDAMRCDELPDGIDYCVFDYGVNSGIGRAPKVLRRVLGLPDNAPFKDVQAKLSDPSPSAVRDGSVKADPSPSAVRDGSVKADPSPSAVRDGSVKADPSPSAVRVGSAKIIDAISDERLRFLMRLKTWPTFGRGWGARVVRVRLAAQSMAKRQPVTGEIPAPAPGKGQVPVNVPGQVSTTGGVIVAGGGAVNEAAQSGAGALTVTLIVLAVIAASVGAFVFWRWRQKRQQEAPA